MENSRRQQRTRHTNAMSNIGKIAIVGVGALAVGALVTHFIPRGTLPRGLIPLKETAKVKPRRKADNKMDQKEEEYIVDHAHRAESPWVREDWHKGFTGVNVSGNSLGQFKRIPMDTLYHIMTFLDISNVLSMSSVSLDFLSVSKALESDELFLRRECVRGIMRNRFRCWTRILNTRRRLDHYAGAYMTLLEGMETSRPEAMGNILKDINRTFPDTEFFKHSVGRRALERLLAICSLQDADIGYTQGMNYLAGFLLVQSGGDECKCYWFITSLMQEYELRWLFLPGLPHLNMCLWQFQQCLGMYLGDLAVYLEEKGLDPSLYAVEWFVTLFTYVLPMESAVRVWDLFLIDGLPIVFQFGLAILDIVKEELMEMSLEEMVRFLKDLPERVTRPDELVQRALQFRVTGFLLGELEELYVRDVVNKRE